jgi:hypothetical protein
MKKEPVLKYALRRLEEEERQNRLGADNDHLVVYWSAYIDGATAQIKEDTERLKELNNELRNKH